MGLSTGNWSPTDYPDAYTFPPYGDANWLKVRGVSLHKPFSRAGITHMYTTVSHFLNLLLLLL